MIAARDDVLEGFLGLWAAGGVGVNVLDARAVPAGVAYPFAAVRVATGDRLLTSGLVYFETFRVTAWVHAVNGATDRRGIARRAEAAARQARTLWPPDSGTCLHCRPVAPPADPTPAGQQARDVAVDVFAWDVLMDQSE